MAKTVIKWETPGLLVGCGAGFVSGPPHSHTVIITENQGPGNKDSSSN